MGLTGRIPQDYLDQLRSRILLSDLVQKDLPLRRVGREWSALCPFHQEKSPSFFVNDQKQFWHCFGCGAHGDGVGWLMRRHSLEFKDAVERLAGEKPPSEAQRWENSLRAKSDEHMARSVFDYALDETELAQQAMAKTIWHHASKIAGTVAETYLRSRGIKLKQIPASLRFSENGWIFSYEGGWRRSGHPAMIAGIQDSVGRLSAIQTTYLMTDGAWHIGRTGAKRPKMVTGPMVDGAIRLSAPGETLMIAEGAETALAGQQLYNLPSWAATGQARRQSILLPDVVRTVVILAENGCSQITTEKAKLSFEQQGREVIVEYPPDDFKDHADMLMGKRIQQPAAVA